MKYFFIIGFVSIFVCVFFFLSWLLNKVADGDILRILSWNKYVYMILFPINFLMWLFEAIKFSTWIDPKNNSYIILFGINVVYVLLLLLVWFIDTKSKIRKQFIRLNYGIDYYKTRINFISEYDQSRTMMLLVLSLVVNPILNIAFIVIFIMSNFS